MKSASSTRYRRWRSIVVCAVAVLITGWLLFHARGGLAWVARCMAARQLNAGAISTAQQWLAWSDRYNPEDGNTSLMSAACFRCLGQQGWREALQLAHRNGAPVTRVQLELRLGRVQFGHLDEGAEAERAALLAAGLSPHEVNSAFVQGYLTRKEPEKAGELLDVWSRDYPKAPQPAYMAGVRWRWLGDPPRAEAEFRKALDRQPRHELARAALAQLLEEQNRLDEALEQCVELANRFPTNQAAEQGLARLLRKLGYIDEARVALKPLVSNPNPPHGAMIEMAEIEFESGNYKEAERWFEKADYVQTRDTSLLASAAYTFAYEGQNLRADRLLLYVDTVDGNIMRGSELAVRLALDPGNTKVTAELRKIEQALSTPPEDVAASAPFGADRYGKPLVSGPELYTFHCSACHGVTGGGDGRAAKHLFPRPRDLRTGKFRLVSALNGVPTLRDLEEVIRRGMPGTSMPSFDNLREEQIRILAQEVLRLKQEGIREQFLEELKEEGEPIDESEIRQAIGVCTTPGEIVHVPQIGPADSRVVAKGEAAYVELGCSKCHGVDGTGISDTPLFDDRGRLTVARDLVHDPFKGGQEPESVYKRVYLGMPGTPHPSCSNVPQDQLVELVQYCCWLSRGPKRTLTNHQRTIQASQRTHSAALAGSPTP